jgi:hypothetical protein
MRLAAGCSMLVLLAASCRSSAREALHTPAGDSPTYITGTALDADNKPAAYAQVTLTLSKTVSIVVTDEAGAYVIRGVEIANEPSAEITVKLDGLQGSTTIAPLHAGKIIVPPIKLSATY